MATRFYKNTTQMEEEKKKAAAPPASKREVSPDLDDLMDNWFFGGPVAAVERAKEEEEKEAHVQVKKEVEEEEEEEEEEEKKTTSRLTQEWLEEAKRLVENSVSRPGTPSRLRLAGTSPSPRFASRARGDRDHSPSSLERRDPRSRSARRHRFPEGISTEILQKSSARLSDASLPSSPSRHSSPNRTATNQWLSSSPSALPEPPRPATPPPHPPKQRLPRPSRFLKEPPPPLPPRAQDPALSPPRNLVESAHRRSVSASTCSIESAFLPRRSVDSSAFHHRRSVDNARALSVSVSVEAEAVDEDIKRINALLKRKKATMEAISSGELVAKVKVVLSGSSTSSGSSMVAAICYAWLLENKGDDTVVVPVMNMRRVRMWKHKQVSWLFQHLGIDASSLLFADEVDLEGLIMARQSSIIVIGQDVLKTNGEVGSHCTVLTDNYCEVAYNLLQAPNLKKLLLAGILLDTQNLNSSAKFFTNRDAEAVQLLLVGSSPDYRQELFEQLMRDHRSSPFIEAMKANYGEPPSEDTSKNGVGKEQRPSKTKSPSISSEEARTPAKDKLASVATPASDKTPYPAPSKALETPSRGKNRFSFAKFFGFGSK